MDTGAASTSGAPSSSLLPQPATATCAAGPRRIEEPRIQPGIPASPPRCRPCGQWGAGGPGTATGHLLFIMINDMIAVDARNRLRAPRPRPGQAGGAQVVVPVRPAPDRE